MTADNTDIAVRLTDQTTMHPDKVYFKDNGWILCLTGDTRYYFPPHAVQEVAKAETLDES